MSKVVNVKELTIGEGIPKICVPITSAKKEGIIAEAKKIAGGAADMVEWRVDFLDETNPFPIVNEVLKELRDILGNIPLLFTFRTREEGGNKSIAVEQYEALNYNVALTGYVDLIDVEVFLENCNTGLLIDKVQKLGVKVIASNHDFNKTPIRGEIVRRLRYMQNIGADIAKIAVMPNSKKDVLELLAATEEMDTAYPDTPIITMSMGRDGAISRIAGEIFGSSITFGIVEKPSAPGQISVDKLVQSLHLLHETVDNF